MPEHTVASPAEADIPSIPDPLAPFAGRPSVRVIPDAVEVSSVVDLERAKLASLTDEDPDTQMRFERGDTAPLVVLRFDEPVRLDAFALILSCGVRTCAGWRVRLSDHQGQARSQGDVTPTGFRATFDPPLVETSIHVEMLAPSGAPQVVPPAIAEVAVHGARAHAGTTTRLEVLVPSERVARANMVPVWTEPHSSVCRGHPCVYAIALAARLCGLERFDATHREAIEARPTPGDVQRLVAQSCPRARDEPAFRRGCGCPRYIAY